jgi:hypothetical protein
MPRDLWLNERIKDRVRKLKQSKPTGKHKSKRQPKPYDSYTFRSGQYKGIPLRDVPTDHLQRMVDNGFVSKLPGPVQAAIKYTLWKR